MSLYKLFFVVIVLGGIFLAYAIWSVTTLAQKQNVEPQNVISAMAQLVFSENARISEGRYLIRSNQYGNFEKPYLMDGWKAADQYGSSHLYTRGNSNRLYIDTQMFSSFFMICTVKADVPSNDDS